MRRFLIWFLPGLIIGALVIMGVGKALDATSTNEYCMSCHIHPAADMSWKRSVHYETQSGYRVACIECHLPPKGHGYLAEKGKTGLRDLWSYWTKDSASFEWNDRGRLENARNYTYESSCIKCHENLFPLKLTKAGEDAHLYFKQTKKTPDLHCINCHLNAGHYIEGYTHGSNSSFGSVSSAPKEIFTEPAKVNAFVSFSEKIPGSSVSFNMIAVPGGRFLMGSPENEPFRKPDEGPAREVEISPFFMAEVEVTWDEYLAFYSQTSAEGRSTDTEGLRTKKAADTDAISGATPPYGQPDQGWGLGKRPAISFSYHAAETYCKWLSKVTGKTYRLPTEAEWEYACKAGSTTDFYNGDLEGNWSRDKNLDKIAWHSTYPLRAVGLKEPNAFGLYDMLGNLSEWCWDYYGEYNENPIIDPKGAINSNSRVYRGGAYHSMAVDARSSKRCSDSQKGYIAYIGFRVVKNF